MYRENKTITSSYDEKALFSRGTSSSLYTIVFLSYYKASHCYLSNKSNLYCLITMSFYQPSTHRRIYMLSPYDKEKFTEYQERMSEYFQAKKQYRSKQMIKCVSCNATVHPLRLEIGINTCISCGDKQAKQRKHCIVPMHKSNYIVVTDRDDLVRINNKSG
jgi:hypothetical protein